MTNQRHDAVAMLISEHHSTKALFQQFEKLCDPSFVIKKKLAEQICNELMTHMEMEEQVFYPAVRAAVKEDDEIDEALVEHSSAKELIQQIMAMEVGEDLYDAKLKVLQEQIEHHTGEEENEIFPKVRETKVDLVALGVQMAGFKVKRGTLPSLADAVHAGS
ncbi:MAG: hemerythrin domain-containing protein [Burkholderiales bacterium]|nr:hemerythrin domain-containing protein [Burkholderiales bacterium]